MEGYSSFFVMNFCLKHILQSLHNHVTVFHRLHLQESPHDVRNEAKIADILRLTLVWQC